MGLFKSSKRKPAPRGQRTATSAPAKYQAVEVQLDTEACPAARETAGRRYLCDDAPLLPLADCDRPDRCACRYARYSDRRQSPRRKSEGALPHDSQLPQFEERRQEEGRRAEELDETGLRRAWIKDTWYR